jgi:hypothetical protein
MSLNLPILPYDVAAGCEIDLTWSTAVATSEGEISWTSSRRSLAIREFHLTIGPDATAEVERIYLAVNGPRYPVGVRSWKDYIAVDEPLDWFLATGGGTKAQLSIGYTPATGSRSYVQPILCPDETEGDIVVKVDGSPTSFTLIDPGIIEVSGELSGGQELTWSGRYVYPCRFVEDSATTKIFNRGVLGFPDIRLREIQAAELMRLAV